MRIAESKEAETGGLYTEENIFFGDIVESYFVDSPSVKEMDNFNWIDNEEERIAEQKKRIKSLISILAVQVPLDSEKKHIQDAVDSLVNTYISVELESKYNLLHSDLFNLDRIVRSKKLDYDVRIPSFAKVKFGKAEWNFGVCHETDTYKDGIEITSKAPPIPSQVKEKAKEFSIEYFEKISKALEEEVIGDFVLRGNKDLQSYSNLYTYWIPKESELNFEIEREEIDPDPILVSHNLGRNFLVAQWNVEEEQPYEHYLREFRDTSLANLGYCLRKEE